ncbi:hypothetical protein HZA57_08095, partial [Candidatus Poribacteria bacterium]|nr:hypothetical protein [Candidatus Poribacteria bacterium]
ELIDSLQAGLGEKPLVLPDDFAATQTGAAAFAREWMRHAPELEVTPRQRLMAGRAARLLPGLRMLVIADLRHAHAFARLLADPESAARFEDLDEDPPEARILPLAPIHLPHVTGEIPYLTHLYELFRSDSSSDEPFDILGGLTAILQAASRQYTEEFEEEVNLTEWRAILQFGRNLALERGWLRPRLYELVMAAKCCVDDDFGAVTLELATRYPPNEEDAPDSVPDLSMHRGLDLYADLGDGLRVAEPAYARPDLTTVEFHFKRRRPSPLEKLKWQQEFFERFGDSICSWPPEDERIETFFGHLRKRALQSISADHTTVEEFSTSMLDGLDFRETMRNWHRGRLYVRRERLPPGNVGPVVLVWRDFPLGTPGLWRSTLYAENQNESDIAIYCSPLGKEMVGPLISRTEYHGVLSVFPAMGIPDVWTVPQLYSWGTCGRLLLASAILLSQERYVAWVAANPPDPDLKNFARRNKVHIIYLPLAGFSRKTLKRLRQVHILGSRRARDWAGDYIGE